MSAEAPQDWPRSLQAMGGHLAKSALGSVRLDAVDFTTQQGTRLRVLVTKDPRREAFDLPLAAEVVRQGPADTICLFLEPYAPGITLGTSGHSIYVPSAAGTLEESIEFVRGLLGASVDHHVGVLEEVKALTNRVRLRSLKHPRPDRVRNAKRYPRLGTGGCFDMFHFGHAALLRECQAIADEIVVFLNTDMSVRGLKGPGRPVVNLESRIDAVRSVLRPRDRVAIFTAKNGHQVVSSSRLSTFVKGVEYFGNVVPEAYKARPRVPVLIVDSILEIHTTDIIKQRSQSA